MPVLTQVSISCITAIEKAHRRKPAVPFSNSEEKQHNVKIAFAIISRLKCNYQLQKNHCLIIQIIQSCGKCGGYYFL